MICMSSSVRGEAELPCSHIRHISVTTNARRLIPALTDSETMTDQVFGVRKGFMSCLQVSKQARLDCTCYSALFPLTGKRHVSLRWNPALSGMPLTASALE